MDTRLATVIASIIVLIGGALAYVVMSYPRAETTNQPLVQPSVSSPVSNPDAPVPGIYKDYSPQAFAATSGTRILFFHAAWCPQCHTLEDDIKSGLIPENVTIFKVNYDDAQALRQKYDVRLQTTLVKVDAKGNEIKKFVAYSNPSLEAVKKNLLP